jgi:hypothetical protein
VDAVLVLLLLVAHQRSTGLPVRDDGTLEQYPAG